MLSEKRRKFIKKTLVGGAGLLTGMSFVKQAISAPSEFTNPSMELSFNMQDDHPFKKIRIGIIGAENSHTVGYGKIFNIEKKFPGMEVTSVWGETEAFAKRAVEKGGIPNMVKDPEEMLGKIDALIVDHRHARYHLDAATPFVKAGIPTFIDKPFCYRVKKGRDFLRMAREVGTPVTSFSSVAQSDATFDIREQVIKMEDIQQIVSFGPVDIHSKYGGLFFYGVHIIQPLMIIFGEDIEKVRITNNGKNAGAAISYRNGMLASLVFSNQYYGWKTFVATNDGIVLLKSRVQETDPPRHIRDMVDMFRTGKEPRSYESILNCVAVLEALEKSAKSDKWEEVKYVEI